MNKNDSALYVIPPTLSKSIFLSVHDRLGRFMIYKQNHTQSPFVYLIVEKPLASIWTVVSEGNFL
jgi:hypothetical protein